MIDDVKTLFEIYESSAAINHSTRSADSYRFSPKEYPTIRAEQEEKKNKSEITKALEYCVARSITGNTEDYKKILFTLQKTVSTLQNYIK